MTIRTPTEVADMFHVHYRTVLEWIANGDLAAVDIANPAATRRRYVITQTQIDDFIAARTLS